MDRVGPLWIRHRPDKDWLGRHGLRCEQLWVGTTRMDALNDQKACKRPKYHSTLEVHGFPLGIRPIASDYLAKSLGETVHFLRSAHHGYGIAIAHFSLGGSQNSQLQWTNSLGETLHFSCRKVISHLVCWTGCNPKPCTWSILTSCTSWPFRERTVHLFGRFPETDHGVLTPRHTETRQCLMQ